MSAASEAVKNEAEQETDTAPGKKAKGIPFEFDGEKYEILAGQPTPKALEYLADYIVKENSLYALLFVREVIGQAQWDSWCEKHGANRVSDMMMAANEAYQGN